MSTRKLASKWGQRQALQSARANMVDRQNPIFWRGNKRFVFRISGRLDRDPMDANRNGASLPQSGAGDAT